MCIRDRARYLKATPRVVQRYTRHKATDLTVDVDSDWAGDKVQRKSTLCIVIRHGPNVIKTQVKAMKGISLSSGEAEYAAIVKGACQGLGVQSMASDWNIPVEVRIRSDSSAAIGISNRLGLGQTRHISVRHLWVQDKVKSKEIHLEKQNGKTNVADLGTKIQTGATINKVMAQLGFRFERAPLHSALKV